MLKKKKYLKKILYKSNNNKIKQNMNWRKGRKKYQEKNSNSNVVDRTQHTIEKHSEYSISKSKEKEKHDEIIENSSLNHLEGERFIRTTGGNSVNTQRVYNKTEPTPEQYADNFGDFPKQFVTPSPNFMSPIINNKRNVLNKNNSKININNNIIKNKQYSTLFNKIRPNYYSSVPNNYTSRNKSSFYIRTPHFRNWRHLKRSELRSYSERPNNLKNIRIVPESPINKDFDFICSSGKGEKFRKVALAVASSRGPTCENRKIMRRNRGDIGGVVDFTTEKTIQKNSYKIMKSKRFYINYDIEPKKKLEATKIIQNWWKNIRIKKYWKKINDENEKKIIIIQKWIRGHLLRKNVLQ